MSEEINIPDENFSEEVSNSDELPVTEETVNNEILVYSGPNIPGVVAKNTIFNNGLPENLKKAMENNPIIRNLLVNIQAYARFQREVQKKGTCEYICYHETQKIIIEGGQR